jgi:hypothetical protein
VRLVSLLLAMILTTAPVWAQWLDDAGHPRPVVSVLDLARAHDAAIFDERTRAFVCRTRSGEIVQYRSLKEYLPENKARHFARPKDALYVLASVEPRTVTKTVRVPEIRWQTQYVDRVIEKPVSVPVETPVYVDRAVYVDRPVLKTIDRPVVRYIEKPVLPTAQLVLAGGLACLVAALTGFNVGVHRERRRIHRLRVTIPELQTLTNEARRVADEHFTSIGELRSAKARVSNDTGGKTHGTVLQR